MEGPVAASARIGALCGLAGESSAVSETFLDGKIELHCGDCLEVLKTLPDNSIDSCVTDPPYHLLSIVKRFGAEGAAPAQFGKDGAYARASAGFMGKQWDGGDIAFRPELWAQVLRVLKPGAFLLAMGGDRTYHRLATAIEDAGFECRGTIAWIFGSGFPKSLNVSKAIDRAAGAEREVVGQRKKLESYGPNEVYGDGPDHGGMQLITAPATAAARQWEGWGTALKPAMELICLARKPLSEGTVAANVLRWGTGAINVDGCRVATDELTPRNNNNTESLLRKGFEGEPKTIYPSGNGRWPANVIHDGSEEVVAGFPDVHGAGFARDAIRRCQPTGEIICARPGDGNRLGDSGSAARFFYTAKADNDDRLGSKHPTVKPLGLMQYLVRLVTPKGGVVIDMFAGTGTTGEAAYREGCKVVLIEREAEYQADIRRRMELVLAGPDERAYKAIKARQGDKPQDHGPLFA